MAHRYPEVKSPLRRQLHAPSPVRKFGLSVLSKQSRSSTSNTSERNTLDSPLRYRTDIEVINVDDEDEDEVDYVEVISDDDDDEVQIVENVVAMDVEEESEKEVSLDVMMVVTTDVSSFEAYRKALKSAEKRASKLKARGFGGFLRERFRGLLRSLRFFYRQDEEEPVKV